MKSKQTILLLTILLSISSLWAQKWVDTLYSIQTVKDITYGQATDFAGNLRTLGMDISYPTDDTVPRCGRPLMVFVHGGAFIGGDKSGMTRMRVDFAKRGFTTASVNYRLGQFQTERNVHCNIPGWDCLNMADTSEWYRAYYRGIQDVNGAIRYLVNNAATYDIDPQRILLAGKSAGGFIAMGVGFLDDSTEVLSTLKGAMPNVLPPHNIYETPCVQELNFDTTIASMNLSRPDLGSYQGTLNQPAATSYKILAVGNFYGGVFNNIFSTTNNQPPALYLFHQPNDLIVPFNRGRVFAGYAYCLTQFPTNCQYIVNRPSLWGSRGIEKMLDTMNIRRLTSPDFLFDRTNNNAPCLLQASNPAVAGHAIDNYWLRTTNMASFFAPKIPDSSICSPTAIDPLEAEEAISVYPNPVYLNETIVWEGSISKNDKFIFRNILGKKVFEIKINKPASSFEFKVSKFTSKSGIYFITKISDTGIISKKIVVQ